MSRECSNDYKRWGTYGVIDQINTTIKNNRKQVSHSLKRKLQIWKGKKKQKDPSSLNWNYSY